MNFRPSKLTVFIVLVCGTCHVRCFAPSRPSNAALDAIDKMQATMNKNQQRTMDLLKDINASVKGLLRANSADATGREDKEPVRQSKSVQPTTPIPPAKVIRLQELQPDSVDSFGSQLTAQQPKPRPLAPPKKQMPPSSADVKLVVLRADQPFDNFLPKYPSEQQKQQMLSESAPFGLVALPPDQPFLNSGQQLQVHQRPRQPAARSPESSLPKTMGLPPDQPINRFSRYQHKQSQSQQDQSALAQVNVVGLQPDQPFGHLLHHPSQSQSQSLFQTPLENSTSGKEIKMKPLRPDQLL